MKLKVTEIQRFCMHDGPGVRTTVFLKGCPLRCAWCHNPETQRAGAELLFHATKCIGCGACAAVCVSGVHSPGEVHTLARERCTLCGACVSACPTGAVEMCGRDMTVADILAVAERDRAFYGELGGLTLSGGEPLAQEGAVALLEAARARGLSTAVETCGHVSPDVLRAAAPFVDLFLWDLKDTDDERHKRYTGVSTKRIRSNLALLNEGKARIRLRCILVKGINTDESHYAAIAEVARSIHNLDGVELLAYHAYGGSKAVLLGGEDNGRREWIPACEEIGRAKDVLRRCGIRI